MRLDTWKKSKHKIALKKGRGTGLELNGKEKKIFIKVQHQPISKLIKQERTVPNMEYSVHCNTAAHDTIKVVCHRSCQTAPGGKTLSNSLGNSHLR